MKVRVAVAGTIGKTVSIDTNPGATIGLDLRLPSGAVATLEQLRALFGSSSNSNSGGGTTGSSDQINHSDLLGLQEGDDHPQYAKWQYNQHVTGQWTFSQLPIILDGGQFPLDEFIEDVIGGILDDTDSILLNYQDYGSMEGRITAELAPSILDAIQGAIQDPGSPVEGYVLSILSGVPAWAPSSGGAESLFDLDDVEIDTFPSDGDVLTFFSGFWINLPPGGGSGGAAFLDQLLDVEIDTGPNDGDVLAFYDGFWINHQLDFPAKTLRPLNYHVDHTLVIADAYEGVTQDSASANNVTVPPNVFEIGTVIPITQLGAGQVTVVEGIGVTVNVNSALTKKLRGQYCGASLWQRALNVWVLYGDLEAV